MTLPELNPLASAPHLVLGFALMATAVLWLAWRGTSRMRPGVRAVVLGCRAVLLLGLATLAFNPGAWSEQREENRSHWAILVDRSLSMGTADAGSSTDQSRWEIASQLARYARDLAAGEEAVEIYSFAGGLDPAGLEDPSPDGDATDLPAAVAELLTRSRAKPGRFTGALVLTDGRQSGLHPDGGARIALRARSGQAPVHGIAFGGEVAPSDLVVRASRRQFVAFSGQEVTVGARVSASGFGPLRLPVTLEDEDGNPVGEPQELELPGDGDYEVRFELDAGGPGTSLFRFRIPLREGEQIAANNQDAFTLVTVEEETRLFMAEGAPYWDSKFLAQMLRQRENMRITSVYRLASDRFFRVETGDERPSDAADDLFPATSEDLASYDLVAFGKGVEYFLDPGRLGLLAEYVRDRGGVIVFTRGKPYSARFEGLEFLEALKWGEKLGVPFRLRPTAEGEAAGLFGDLLPGAEDPIWSQLPELEETHQALEMKPFTEVLLEGVRLVDGREQTFPVLMSRRFGRGLVVTLNVDGMWRWDFSPGSEEPLEGHYEEFWTQLIQWAVTYSEFLPGHDLSLHLDETTLYPGETTRARIGRRSHTQSAGIRGEGGSTESGALEGEDEGGPGSAGESAVELPDTPTRPGPLVRVKRDGVILRDIPAARPGVGSSRWEAGVVLEEPGEYRIEAFDPSRPDQSVPGLPLTVLPLPGEADRLSADPEFLRTFAEASGGGLVDEVGLPALVDALSGEADSVDLARAVWEPTWDRGWILAILLFTASIEWFSRRRSGLL